MKIEPHPEVIYTQLGDSEAVLLHLGSHEYFTLNETGNLIWQGIAAGETVSDISQHLTATYAVSMTDAAVCMQELIGALEAAGLVKPCTAERL